MPMGLRSAAYVAQLCTSAIVHIHRSFRNWSVNYLGDFGSCEQPVNAWNSYNCMERILQAISVDEAAEKSVPPTTRLEFLGNTLDTNKMTIEVSHERKQELMALLTKWKEKSTYGKKELQSLIGKLSFVTNCIRPGRIFLSRLINQSKNIDEVHRYQVNQEMHKDLDW